MDRILDKSLRAKYGISVEAALEKLLARLKAPARPANMREGQPHSTRVLQSGLQMAFLEDPDSF
jgi:hypothetical protein